MTIDEHADQLRVAGRDPVEPYWAEAKIAALERELAGARERLESDLAHGNSILLWLGLSGQSAHMGDVATIAAHAIDKLKGELAEARDKVTTLQAAVMAHKTWENEAVAQASNANFALNKIRKELSDANEMCMSAYGTTASRALAEIERLSEAVKFHLDSCEKLMEQRDAARAEVEAAARWSYNRGAKEWREMDFVAAWSRYQQERGKG